MGIKTIFVLRAFLVAALFTACSIGGGSSGNGKGDTSAPVGLKVTGATKNSITLVWTTVTGAVKYKIYRAVTSTGQYQYVDETEYGTYTVADLSPAHTYYFKVSSVGSDGIEGPQSGYAAGTTDDGNGNPVVPDTTPPGEVLALAATPGNGSVALNWMDPADADFLQVEITFTPAATGSTQPIAVNKGTQSKTIAGLNNGTTYTFMVKTVDTAGNRSAGTTATAVTASVPETYQVGDIGPAGGLIFYVKGNYNDGWKYLEAAPASTEQTVMWGYNGAINGTDTGIGAGKRNTATIMAYQTRTGNLCLAAMRCDELSAGGFDDWFLPSRDELMLIYTNLKSKGLGGFGNGWYWSSSEYGSSYAYCQRLSDGSQDYGSKTTAYSVRAVRAF
jgi:hypothetical protein